jgi:transposase
MDMNGAYEAEVKSCCPQARMVYDQFQVVAKYGHAVIDQVRTAEAKRHTACGERQVIKGSRWLLLRNSPDRKRQDRVHLRELATLLGSLVSDRGSAWVTASAQAESRRTAFGGLVVPS